MNNINVNISLKPSLKELGRRFGAINVSRFLADQIKKLSFVIEKEAKQVTPVDTGLLRSSIRVLPMMTPLERVIQPHTNYAIYVHEGTRFMRPRPFMEQGAEAAVKGFEATVAKELEDYIQGKIK